MSYLKSISKSLASTYRKTGPSVIDKKRDIHFILE